MNIDFIEASTYLYNDKPFFGNVEHTASYKNGNNTYVVNGCNKLKIVHNEFTGKFVLSGSIMYYAQGHNFTYDKKLFVESIGHLGKLLNLDLWGLMINIFECGVIIPVDKKPKDYIQHHREGKGMSLYDNPKDKGNFRSFIDKYVEMKMYDAGRNIQHKQGMTMKQIIEESGWNPEGNYLKWELHYLKPEKVLNGGIGLLLSDLVNPNWEEAFKQDIYSQYTKLIPMKTLIQPTEKANYKTLDIFAIELIEAKLNEGATLAEIKKMLYARINASAILNNADKDARKRQVKQIFDKMQLSEDSVWDISQQLRKAIYE